MTTTLSKRSFVLGAASAAAAPLAWARAPAVAEPLPGVLPPLGEGAAAGDWQAYLHQPFTLQAAGERHTVVLSRIVPVAAGPGLQQFVLAFDTTGAAAVPAGTYFLQHASGQTAQLYLGDAGRQGPQQRLRAEFSLLSAAA